MHLQKPSLEITNLNLKRQSASFLLVSTLKSSLSIIEGSDVGVGFRLEVGDIVQSTYDLVDFTWKILLYGILLVTFSKIISEAHIIHLGQYLLAVGFGLGIISLFLARGRKLLAALGGRLAVAGLIVAFYIPVSTIVSFHACNYFVSSIEQDLDQQLGDTLADWQAFRQKLSLTEIKTIFTSAGAFVKELFLKLTRLMITYTCLIIIKYLLFPLIVAYGFFIVSKYFLKRVFEEHLA